MVISAGPTSLCAVIKLRPVTGFPKGAPLTMRNLTMEWGGKGGKREPDVC